MKTRTPIKWTSNIEKVRTGTFITRFTTQKGRCLVLGDDGKQHNIGTDKIQERES